MELVSDPEKKGFSRVVEKKMIGENDWRRWKRNSGVSRWRHSALTTDFRNGDMVDLSSRRG